jgi:hypothetical protein
MARKIEIGPLNRLRPGLPPKPGSRSATRHTTRGRLTRIFEEMVSGVKRDRRELGRLLEHLRAGDVMTVTRLDAVGR